MKQLSFFSCLTVVLAAAILIPELKAETAPKHRTEVNFSQPTEIPGMVLGPGSYVMKIPDPVTHRDMVGFYNPDESHVFGLVRTIPAYRLNVTSKTSITFEERANGAPEAIHKWFSPSEHWGYEFVYAKAETLPQVAESAPPPAPARPVNPPVAVAAAPQPVPTPAHSQPAQQLAQVTQQRPAPAPAPAAPTPAPKELPKTASDLPLAFEAGAILMLAGLCLRLKT